MTEEQIAQRADEMLKPYIDHRPIATMGIDGNPIDQQPINSIKSSYRDLTPESFIQQKLLTAGMFKEELEGNRKLFDAVYERVVEALTPSTYAGPVEHFQYNVK